MGWLWWGSKSSTTQSDAYTSLDPKLRDFLDKESASNAASSQTRQAQQPPSEPPDPTRTLSYSEQLGLKNPDQHLTAKSQSTSPPSSQTQEPRSETESPSAIPPESLYQDGRYAHLWSTYQPPASPSETPQDKLSSVVDSFNARKALISRAAVENCIFEQLAQQDCFNNGGWYARMTMCRDEGRRLNRCFVMQSKFLKALGYGSAVAEVRRGGGTVEEAERKREEREERVQMHADRLYHEMLEREKREEQEKVVDEKPMLASSVEAREGRIPGIELLSDEKRKVLEEETKGKTQTEKALEIEFAIAEARQAVEYNRKLGEYFTEEEKARQDRKERGKETISDAVKRAWNGQR